MLFLLQREFKDLYEENDCQSDDSVFSFDSAEKRTDMAFLFGIAAPVIVFLSSSCLYI